MKLCPETAPALDIIQPTDTIQRCCSVTETSQQIFAYFLLIYLCLFQELQELIESATLANLLYRGKQEAAEAAFTSEEMESRVWLAVIRVPVTHPSQVADTAVSQSDAMQKIVLQQSLPEAPGYRLPLVNNNQSAVANELILRVLLMEGVTPQPSFVGNYIMHIHM